VVEFILVVVDILEFMEFVVVPVEVFVVIVVFVFMFVFIFELRMFEFVLLSPQAIAPTATRPRTALIKIFFINSPVFRPGNAIRPIFLSKY